MHFNVFALPEGPNMAPNGSKTASEFNIGLKIYRNRLEEGSERPPKPPKSSMGALRCDLGPPGGK